MGFCRDAKLLAAVGMDNNHTIFVWDWRRNKILAELKGHTDVPPKVYGVVAGAYVVHVSLVYSLLEVSGARPRVTHSDLVFFIVRHLRVRGGLKQTVP